MKRPKNYMHRPGMRFDRRHVQGTPDAGFIGSDIDVVTITGSVQSDIRQRYSTYDLEPQQVIGYPRGWEDMFAASNGVYNSGVTTTWGHGFDINGANSYALNFVANGGGSGIDSWDFTAFTDHRGLVSSVQYDMGGKWQALTSWKGVPTFITASSIESSLGPRGMMDLGTIPAVSGSAADVDYALRLMTTSSFLYTRIPNFYAGGYGRAAVVVFKYDDVTASFDIHSFGRPGDENASSCLSVVTGNLRWASTSSQGFYEFSVPVEPDTWHIALALNSQFGSDNRIWLGAIPFWGGEQQIKSFNAGLGGYFNSHTASYIGDCHFFGASDTLRIAALYMGAVGPAGVGEPVAPEVTASLPAMQAALSARARTKFESNSAIEDSLTAFGTDLERRYFDQKLLGLGTGALGRSLGVTSITTGSIPSWANSHIRNSAFVATTLSSSNHESQVLNLFRSGSAPLETTAVPASATLYYSKSSKYNKIIVKKSASYADTVGQSGYSKGVDGFYPPAAFLPGSGSLMSLISGSTEADASTPYSPGTLLFNVPVSGKLVDISVWVELHHQSASVPIMPLGAIGLGLKSPNVKWGLGHPMLNFNDPSVGSIFSNGDAYGAWKDTFILWEGPGALMLDQRTYGLGPNHFGYSDVREKFPGWDRDLSIRTIFSDHAPVNNPRHNIPLSVGSASYVGSPNAALGINSAWGMAVYWTGSSGSPPAGWLSGPGGTAAENEWPTSGTNRGAERIKPLYPLLDPIEVTIPPGNYPTVFFGQQVSPEKFVGTRPGLRGTEISGTWHLTFWTGNDDDGSTDYQMPVYFRQARLEITYEEHQPIARVRTESDVGAHPPGQRQVWQISGSSLSSFISASNNIHVIDTERSSIGRTFGVAMNTGSINLNSSALVYRLTGTLADYSGSAPGWLLNNEFGMPRIPLSSASLVAPSDDSVATIHPQDILVTRPLLDGAQRLSDAAKDAAPPQTRAAYAAEVVTGSLT